MDSTVMIVVTLLPLSLVTYMAFMLDQEEFADNPHHREEFEDQHYFALPQLVQNVCSVDRLSIYNLSALTMH